MAGGNRGYCPQTMARPRRTVAVGGDDVGCVGGVEGDGDVVGAADDDVGAVVGAVVGAAAAGDGGVVGLGGEVGWWRIR